MTTNERTRNSEVLADFVAYCEAHPTERFWQALRNWSGANFIYQSEVLADDLAMRDTFYLEGRDR